MTIGPEPMMRTRLRSVRLGISRDRGLGTGDWGLGTIRTSPYVPSAPSPRSAPGNRQTDSPRHADRGTLQDDIERRTPDATYAAVLLPCRRTDSCGSLPHRPGAFSD